MVSDKNLINFFVKRGFSGSKLANSLGNIKLSGVLQRAFKAGKFAKNRKLFTIVSAFKKNIQKKERIDKKQIKRQPGKPKIFKKKIKKKVKKKVKKKIKKKEEIGNDFIEHDCSYLKKTAQYKSKNLGIKKTKKQIQASYLKAVLYTWSSICFLREEDCEFHDHLLGVPKKINEKQNIINAVKLKNVEQFLHDNHYNQFVKPDPLYHQLRELLEFGFIVFLKDYTKKYVYNLDKDQWYLRSVKKVKKKAKTTKRLKL